ncbi:sulfur carrier protein ThiS [Gordonia neofelifaecis]|uniref:Sulfur carrier protein ThiS n=1 Tax=Gordonia neofelifaecis NRRL B-59395 TaxID=644548 RepID=F1YN83_9ACTN|nr:sulfur carrier protein ThiS [Gordonia neofelifaecis]EGD53794.1 sulfur carrier protein ThiS [Gordonia neofelifaecis NRRL B-59395]
MELTVNGDTVILDEAPTVPALLAHLGLPDCGVAVAVDGIVRPKAEWDTPIKPYAEIDVLTAVQGG